MFEKGVAEHGVIFDAKDTQETEVIKGAVKPDVPVQNTIENKETSVSETVDVTKSQEYLDLVKKLEEANAKNAQAELIIKAAVEAEKKNALTKAKGFTFAAEEDHESLADFIIEKANAPVVALLEKAQARISELEAEVETVKKEFGTKETGVNKEVETDDLTKSAEEVLKANVQKALEAARKSQTA